jgi:hypothetical protein
LGGGLGPVVLADGDGLFKLLELGGRFSTDLLAQVGAVVLICP